MLVRLLSVLILWFFMMVWICCDVILGVVFIRCLVYGCCGFLRICLFGFVLMMLLLFIMMIFFVCLVVRFRLCVIRSIEVFLFCVRVVM